MTHLVGCVVSDSSMLFSRSVLTVEVCECAGVFTLSATRSAFVVGVSEILLVSREALISLILPSQSPGSSWVNFFYYPLVIILGFIALDALRVGCGLRSYYHIPRFVEWDVVPVFNSKYFFFQFPTLTGSCIDGMIASAIRTLKWIVTIVNVVVRILLSTFATFVDLYNYPRGGRIFDNYSNAMDLVWIAQLSPLSSLLLSSPVF